MPSLRPARTLFPSLHRGGRRATGLVAAAVLLATGLTGLAVSPASAAGGVLDLQIAAVNQADGTAITDLIASVTTSPLSTPVTYKVQYSCTAAACDGTHVQFTPPPSDPWGLNPAGRSVLRYASWVAPAAIPGATISGDDLTGKVIDLGNLAAGTSGTFSVSYNSPGISGNDTAGGQFFPDGSDIAMSATATSATASAKTSGSHVTWHVGTPAGPAAATTSGKTVKPDTTTTMLLSMSTGSEAIFAGASIAGDPRVVAAGDYKVVYHAPAEAIIGEVRNTATGAVDPDAVVDNAAHTITWTKGSAATPSYGARGGWGGPGLSAYNSGGAASNNALVGAADKAYWGKRSVDLSFPVGNFPDADGSGCNFRTAVSSTLDVTVHYLDTARTQKSTTVGATNNVACGAPFGGLAVNKFVANGATSASGDGALASNVQALNVPATGNTDTGSREWRVQASNLGNVDGTAVIDEPDLDQDHIKVSRITTYTLTSSLATFTAPDDWTATVEWTDNTGATGRDEIGAGEFVDAAAGRWFTSARITAVVPAGRILRTDTGTSTVWQVGYRFKVDDGAVPLIGQQRTNTADVTISYAADADGDGVDDDYVTAANGTPLPSRAVALPASRTVQYTQPLTTLNATFNGQPVVQGGGAVQVGTHVTFAVRGQSGAAWPGTTITPETVFIAPVGWKIVPGSGSLTAPGTGVLASIPAGVTYRYGTGTFGSETRDYVVATYPSSVALPTASGVLTSWPTLSATAYPTNLAVPGVNPVAGTWAGDAGSTWYDATTNAYTSGPGQFRVGGGNNFAADAADVDGDANTTEELAALATAFAIPVTASDALSVVKELCIPSLVAADGCDWVADPTVVHEITRATAVTYRIRIVNGGNTTLHHVVAYDVLPYAGDTGLLAGVTARGSQFAMTLSSVDSSSPGLDLAYSGSTNPARPEVNPGASGTTDDWGATVAGKKAIRVAVDGDLAPGDTKQVTFLASVGAGAAAPKQACNTVAIDSDETLPAEPLAVCARLVEADLAVTTGSLSPWKEGDATTIPFTVVNHGGSDGADASVAVTVPAGLRVDDLAPDGWTCTVPGGATAPIAGPVDLTCTPVDGQGDPRTLDAAEPETLALAVTPTAPSATPVCVRAAVSGSLFDPAPGNNSDEVCATVGAAFVAAPELTLDKSSAFETDANDDGKADAGDVLTYSFSVENTGNVDVAGVTITDAKIGTTSPASVTIAAGATKVFTASYTVTQADVDAGATRNSASASGTPTSGGTVTSNTDTDVVDGPTPAPSLSIEKTSELTDDAHDDGLADKGDELTYSFEVENTGNVTLTGVTVADPLPGLGAISPAPVTLAPGETQVFTADYTVRQSDVDAGGTYNEATATGTPPTGDPVDSDPDSDAVPGPDPKPVLSVVKTAELTTDEGTHGTGDAGDVITYTFTVHNAGPATAHDVAVHDPLPGLSAITPAPVATLAPGDDAVFTATYTVTLADVDRGGVHNQATAVFTPPTPRGGEAPAPVLTPSNEVSTPTSAKAQPTLSTRATAAAVQLQVRADGSTVGRTLADVVTLHGLVAGGSPVRGTATLYGPATRRSASMCTAGQVAGTVGFEARNGTTTLPQLRVTRPGHYTWVVRLPGNELNKPVQHACGLAAESVLVSRAAYPAPVISTGFARAGSSSARYAGAPVNLFLSGLGIKAPVQTVGVRRGSMSVPGTVGRLGWLRSSAAIGDAVGTTVIAGHVSDRHDRPGAFWRLRSAKVGQVVTVRDSAGKTYRYRVVAKRSYSRTKALPASLFSTTGQHQLVLVTCTGKVTRPGGGFHYTRNLAVTAVRVG